MSLTTVDQGLLGTYAQYTGFKNRIINGAMMIDQRNAGASATLSNTGYSLDRWQTYLSQSSKYTVQQNAGGANSPAGFNTYLGVVSSSAYSVGSGDYFALAQPIEGQNVADFGWGTSNASTVTLSFKVLSSLTGTFGGALQNNGGSRSYPFSYSISAANTWTTVSITISGDTSGTWLKTNGLGINVIFGLGVGSTYSGTAGSWAAGNYFSATGATSVVGTNGATFYITGVQLEKGSTATSFDYRPYGTELALCQRYYLKEATSGSGYTWVNGFIATGGLFRGYKQFPVVMRAAPTFGYNTASNSMVCNDASGNKTLSSFGGVFSTIGGNMSFNTAAGNTTGSGAVIYDVSGTAGSYMDYSAEL